MRPMQKTLRFVIFILCSLEMTFSPAQENAPAMSTTAASYLNHVLDIMEKNALHTRGIDWFTVRRETFRQAEGAQTTVDTYPAIYYALTQLNEHHSFLRLPDNLSEEDKQRTYVSLRKMLGPYGNQMPKPPASPFLDRVQISGHLLQAGNSTIAYIVIPACGGKHSNLRNNRAEYQMYANSLHRIAADLEASHPLGWIVDLRGNTGGNMYPMLAGIGFVLGEGRLGSFVSLSGVENGWFYRQGMAGARISSVESISAKITDAPLALPDLPAVAVLIDAGTISSGEAVAISFAGRPRERSFGTHTFGLSSGNQWFPLADGASLLLNTTLEADRLHHIYPDGIEPDVSFPEPTIIPDEASDPVIHAAQEWLVSFTSQETRSPSIDQRPPH